MTTDPALVLPPDSQIAQYRVVKKLGEGGMGAVYLAEHSLLGRKAAVKVLHPSFTQRADIVERFFNEARAATSIADPGIVQIFDFGYQNDVAYIVMELLDGESLDARLKRLGRLPVSDVLRLTRQMSLSLDAAHRRGVIHRDLKPENVFVVPDPEAAGGERTKILDFGIAKLTDAEQNRHRTQTGLMMGTPIYMSPEQCRGLGTLDHRSDIYSLGCVIFHLLAGRPPFDAEGAGELIAAHLKEVAPATSQFVQVPPAIDAIIARCLEKEPEQRFESMRQLAAAVDGALRSISGVDLARMTPLPTMATGPVELASPPPKRWWIPVAATGIIAIGAVAVLVALPSKSSPSPPPPPPTVTEPVRSPPPAAASPPAPAPTPAPPSVPAPTPPPAVTSPPPQHSAKPAVVHRKPIAATPAKPTGSATSVTPPTPPPVVDPYSDR